MLLTNHHKIIRDYIKFVKKTLFSKRVYYLFMDLLITTDFFSVTKIQFSKTTIFYARNFGYCGIMLGFVNV